MNLNLSHRLRAALRALFPARSPKRVGHGVYVARSQPFTDQAPPVPARLEDDTHFFSDVLGDLDEPQIERTRRIPIADMNHTHRAARDGFPRRGATPRILPGRAEVPDGNGDVFDRNSGSHHRDRWLP